VVTKSDLIERDQQATTYLVTGRAAVPRGLVQDDVVVLSGTATVEGTVEDDVLVVNGRARIDGTVHGDVTVLRGSARLGPRADVGGDVRASGNVRQAPGADVEGEVGSASLLGALQDLPRVFWFALWLMAGLAVLAAGLLLPRPIARAAHAGAGRPGPAGVLGGAGHAQAPLAVLVLAASLLGLGVAVLLGAALVVAGTAGAAAAAVALTRQVGMREGPLGFLAGWGALGAGLAVALLVSPFLAVLGGGTILAFGIGSLVPGREAPAPRRALVDLGDEPPVPADDEPVVLASFPIEAGSTSPSN
jgi:cytoskeletal protein CcmA (bactofilin family)